jgi:hypothetical protein
MGTLSGLRWLSIIIYQLPWMEVWDVKRQKWIAQNLAEFMVKLRASELANEKHGFASRRRLRSIL